VFLPEDRPIGWPIPGTSHTCCLCTETINTSTPSPFRTSVPIRVAHSHHIQPCFHHPAEGNEREASRNAEQASQSLTRGILPPSKTRPGRSKSLYSRLLLNHPSRTRLPHQSEGKHGIPSGIMAATLTRHQCNYNTLSWTRATAFCCP
jgi:hypothetical protein